MDIINKSMHFSQIEMNPNVNKVPDNGLEIPILMQSLENNRLNRCSRNIINEKPELRET
jgi:hypothetical protein